MSFFGFGQSVEVEIVLNDAESRKRAEHKTEDGKKEKYFLFYDGETVSGKVSLALKHPNKRLEHQGIKIEFIGQIGESAPRAAPLPPRPRARPPRAGTRAAGEARRSPRPCGARPAAAPLRGPSPCQKGPRAARRGVPGTGGVPPVPLGGGTAAQSAQLSLRRATRLGFLPPGFRSEMPQP